MKDCLLQFAASRTEMQQTLQSTPAAELFLCINQHTRKRPAESTTLHADRVLHMIICRAGCASYKQYMQHRSTNFQHHSAACVMSNQYMQWLSGLLPLAAPVMIAEKHKLFFSSLSFMRWLLTLWCRPPQQRRQTFLFFLSCNGC